MVVYVGYAVGWETYRLPALYRTCAHSQLSAPAKAVTPTANSQRPTRKAAQSPANSQQAATLHKEQREAQIDDRDVLVTVEL